MTVTFQPDYRRLLKAINHEEPDRVPLADFQADTAMKDQFMGRPIRTIADHVAFRPRPVSISSICRELRLPRHVAGGLHRHAALVALFHRARLRDGRHLRRRARSRRARTWIASSGPTRDGGRLAHGRGRAGVPPGLGIITGVGGIFTRTWMLMGYEHFSEMLADNLDFVAEITAQVGQIQCRGDAPGDQDAGRRRGMVRR